VKGNTGCLYGNEMHRVSNIVKTVDTISGSGEGLIQPVQDGNAIDVSL